MFFYRRKISTESSERHSNARQNPPNQDEHKYTDLEIGVNSASVYSELNINSNSEYELNNL